MASLEPDTLQALGALLEDARASVEILVELANGATETAERETCMALGQAAVLHSCALHERLTTAGAPISRYVNGIVPRVLDTECYDDRLRAFARHQAGVCEQAQSLARTTDDRETRKVLHELYDSGVRAALWCEQRAASFAASRLLLFGEQRAASATHPPQAAPPEASGADAGDIRDSTPAHAPNGNGNGNGAAEHGPAHALQDETADPSLGPLQHDGASSDGER